MNFLITFYEECEWHLVTGREDAGPVAHAMEASKSLEEKLQNIMADIIIQRTKEPTDWVPSLVITEQTRRELYSCVWS